MGIGFNMLKTERRWQVRKLIILVNLFVLGFAYYMDVNHIKADVFKDAMNYFQIFSGIAFAADYMTKPEENKDE